MSEIRTREARKLCTASELELFTQSLRPQITPLTAARLKSRISRARRLRDKYRDLAQQQRGEQRGKREPMGQTPARGNLRTQRKVDLFQQTLDRFEKRLAALQARAEAQQRKQPQKGAAESTAQAATGGEEGAGTPARKKAARVKKKPARSTASPLGAMLDEKTTRRDRGRAAASSSSTLGRQANVRSAAGVSKVKGHISAQTKRRQAKRDSRN